MPLPNQKHTSSRRKVRRGSLRLKSQQTVVCDNCGAKKRQHEVCLKCGVYKKRSALAIRLPKALRAKKNKVADVKKS